MTYSWLVENFTKDGKSTGLYMACQVNMTVTADVNAARKFRRQITAEFRALDMREARRGDWRAVEHGFDDSEPPNGPDERAAQPVAGAVALWQYRWTNPAGYEDEPVEALEWKELAPRPYTNQTLEDRIAELRGYEHNGKAIYEVRSLYAAPQPQAAPAPEPSAQATPCARCATPEPCKERGCFAVERDAERFGAQQPSTQADDPDSWEANAQYLLDRCPHTVWQRPGGGPLDLKSTLVVTFMGMQQKIAASPQPQPSVPLNFDQLQRVMSQHFGGRELTDDEADSAEAFARAIERAHGIAPKAAQPNAELSGARSVDARSSDANARPLE